MSACSAKITENNGCLMVAGNLNFSTVPVVWKSSLGLIEGKKNLSFDLSKVTLANSAGLALLLEWKRYAHHHNQSIVFNHIPTSLMSIATASSLAELF